MAAAKEFKVGDVWKMVSHDHKSLKAGAEFTVLAVDSCGDAELAGDIYVAWERIGLGHLVLVSREGA